MKHLRFIRYATFCVALSLCGALAPVAGALAGTNNALPAPYTPADSADANADGAGSASGNVSELQNLIQSGGLTELRSTKNGSYGAQLYFLPREMVYYVALSQDKKLWRVMKSQDESRAESVYVQFARKSFELADGEIRRIQLQAQTNLLDRVIAVSASRATRLSADLALAQQQDSQVSERQQKLQEESAALATDKAEAERKLRALQQQVDALQRQSESGFVPMSRPSSR
jgi:hypothetical protein